MPKSVIVATSALLLVIALNIGQSLLATYLNTTSTLRETITISVGILVLVGMIQGHRLAWQWGRILGLFAALIHAIRAFSLLFPPEALPVPDWIRQLVGVILLVQAISLLTIFVALGRSSAREHFRLKCPACGEFTSAAADFLFNRAKCKSCKEVW